MTEQLSLITPPSKLVHQWRDRWPTDAPPNSSLCQWLATQAANWGADQELEACCEFMQHEDFHGFARELRAARRPKPPILKEQALAALQSINSGTVDGGKYMEIMSILQKALEQLPDAL
jgi:hypothetical protein